MAEHALVVGGSIHDRLARRRSLRAVGFVVTVEPSVWRGLRRLERFSYTVCSLDLSQSTRVREWRRAYLQACADRGIELEECGMLAEWTVARC